MKIQWNVVTWYSKLLAVILFIGALPVWTFYIGTQYQQTKDILATEPSVVSHQVNSKQNSQTTYSIPLCGITLAVKTNQKISTSTGDLYGQILVGGNLPASTLEVFCHARSKQPQTGFYDISTDLAVQSDGSSAVNKNNYLVFDQKTLSSISQMYSAQNRGYRKGSETIGFQTNDWIYEFSFLNPAQNKNQDSFVISVNQ